MYVRKKKLPKQHSYEKCSRLTLMKLTPRVALSEHVYAQLLRVQIPKAQKYGLWALESVLTKAACKMLVKSTPVVDFTNIL